jgi:hypothetical protein
MFSGKRSPTDYRCVSYRRKLSVSFGERTPPSADFRGGKDFRPVEAESRLSFLFHLSDPDSLKISPISCLATPDSLRTHGRPSSKSAVCGLNSSSQRFASVPPFKILDRPAKAAGRSCSADSFPGSLCFGSLSAKKYGTPYFQLESELSKYS